MINYIIYKIKHENVFQTAVVHEAEWVIYRMEG